MRLIKAIENDIALKTQQLSRAKTLVDERKLKEEIHSLNSELKETLELEENNLTTQKLRKLTGDDKKISGQIIWQ